MLRVTDVDYIKGYESKQQNVSHIPAPRSRIQ